MKIKVRIEDELGKVYNQELPLNKTQKGYMLKIDNKVYFPKNISAVLRSGYDKELWLLVLEDQVSFGIGTLVCPDYFVKENEDGSISIEKEVPKNRLFKEDDIYEWDYPIIYTLSSPDDTDNFIDEMEIEGLDDKFIKNALDQFYELQKSKVTV